MYEPTKNRKYKKCMLLLKQDSIHNFGNVIVGLLHFQLYKIYKKAFTLNNIYNLHDTPAVSLSINYYLFNICIQFFQQLFQGQIRFFYRIYFRKFNYKKQTYECI